jgi:hypothetical protein
VCAHMHAYMHMVAHLGMPYPGKQAGQVALENPMQQILEVAASQP